jgi:hypothetical protein
MARRTKEALTPRWRRRVWNESAPPFSYELVVFYVLAHLPYFLRLWVMTGLRWDMHGVAPGTAGVVNEMMSWFRITAWLILAWTVTLGISAWIPRNQRSRARLAIILFAIVISVELVVTAYFASNSVNGLIFSELFGGFEFRYDPASQ